VLVADKCNKRVQHWRNDSDRGKPKYWEKNLSQCHSARQKSHMNWPGIETEPVKGDMSATSSQRHGMTRIIVSSEIFQTCWVCLRSVKEPCKRTRIAFVRFRPAFARHGCIYSSRFAQRRRFVLSGTWVRTFRKNTLHIFSKQVAAVHCSEMLARTYTTQWHYPEDHTHECALFGSGGCPDYFTGGGGREAHPEAIYNYVWCGKSCYKIIFKYNCNTTLFETTFIYTQI
jgi:hypothetical protein